MWLLLGTSNQRFIVKFLGNDTWPAAPGHSLSVFVLVMAGLTCAHWLLPHHAPESNQNQQGEAA